MDVDTLATCVSCIVFCTVVSSGICIHTVFLLCINDPSAWISNTYRNLTVLISLFFTLSNVVGLARFITIFYVLDLMSDADDDARYKAREHPFSFTVDILAFSGNVMFYVMILLRITVPFRLGKAWLYTLSSLIFIAATASLVYCVVIIFLWDNKHHYVERSVVLGVMSVADAALNVALLGFFVYKMRQTVKGMDIVGSDDEANAAKVNLLSNVMTKHFVLFSIAIVANQGFFVSKSSSVHFTDMHYDDIIPWTVFCSLSVLHYDEFGMFCSLSE